MSEHNKPAGKSTGSILRASLMLPGLAALAAVGTAPAHAESPPEQTTISVKYSHYQESQGSWDRVSVDAPQFYIQAPIGEHWSVEGSAVVDSVSGASPRAHTLRSGASVMSDERTAGDVRFTRYFDRAAISASLAYSDEHDYQSKALGLQGRWSTDDNNRTWTAGLGLARDRIDNTSNGVNTAINQKKRTTEVMGGVTQVMTPNDIVQFNLTRTMGSGYFDDPYKSFDTRPDKRNAWIALGRWNHHITSANLTTRASYRYYSDTFGIKSHTMDLELVKPWGQWTFTPGIRYYSQSAANFYFDPVLDANGQYNELATFQRAASMTGYRSPDQRLAAFGAITASMKVSYAFSPNTSADIKLDLYRQSTRWRMGKGSPGLDPMNATIFQIGLTHRF